MPGPLFGHGTLAGQGSRLKLINCTAGVILPGESPSESSEWMTRRRLFLYRKIIYIIEGFFPPPSNETFIKGPSQLNPSYERGPEKEWTARPVSVLRETRSEQGSLKGCFYSGIAGGVICGLIGLGIARSAIQGIPEAAGAAGVGGFMAGFTFGMILAAVITFAITHVLKRKEEKEQEQEEQADDSESF
jgi:hypothetical protein